MRGRDRVIECSYNIGLQYACGGMYSQYPRSGESGEK